MFPLTIHGQTFADPPSFAAAVLRDAQALGGRVVAGQSPEQWLPPLVESGILDRSTVVGLAAALMRMADPAALTEGIRIALALKLHELCPLFSAALSGVSLNLLLQPAPHHPDRSIEDCLLEALVQLMDGDDDLMRATVLTHLRNAGLHQQEFKLLTTHGSASELSTGLPAIFAESLPAPQALLPLLHRDAPIIEATLEILSQMPEPFRRDVFASIEKTLPELAKQPDVQSALLS